MNPCNAVGHEHEQKVNKVNLSSFFLVKVTEVFTYNTYPLLREKILSSVARKNTINSLLYSFFGGKKKNNSDKMRHFLLLFKNRISDKSLVVN